MSLLSACLLRLDPVCLSSVAVSMFHWNFLILDLTHSHSTAGLFAYKRLTDTMLVAAVVCLRSKCYLELLHFKAAIYMNLFGFGF